MVSYYGKKSVTDVLFFPFRPDTKRRIAMVVVALTTLSFILQYFNFNFLPYDVPIFNIGWLSIRLALGILNAYVFLWLIKSTRKGIL